MGFDTVLVEAVDQICNERYEYQMRLAGQKVVETRM